MKKYVLDFGRLRYAFLLLLIAINIFKAKLPRRKKDQLRRVAMTTSHARLLLQKYTIKLIPAQKIVIDMEFHVIVTGLVRFGLFAHPTLDPIQWRVGFDDMDDDHGRPSAWSLWLLISNL